MNSIEQLDKEEMERLTADGTMPSFAAGDTVRVNVKVVEGTRERVQAFEGVCIAKNGSGLNEAFTVRKLSYGEGVERVFPLYSPNIDSIDVVRRGDVRRAKLYYLRGRQGKSARIAEKTDGFSAKLTAEEKRIAQEEKRARDAKTREAKNAKADAATAPAPAAEAGEE